MSYFGKTLEYAAYFGDHKESAGNEYQRAADMMREYVSESGFEIPFVKASADKALDVFLERFAPEKLAALPDAELLRAVFYSAGNDQDALWYWLEKNADCRDFFGSIAGGSAYKFGLFQKRDTGEWMAGSSQKPKILNEDEALETGKQIRNALVKGAGIVRNAKLNTLADYEKLDEKLKQAMGEQYYNRGWVHKYLCMVCPDRLSGFHSPGWQRHVLYALQIKPSERYYARSGQIAMTENAAGWYYRELFSVVSEMFGGIRQFVRLGTSDSRKNYMSEWSRKSVAGIGWRATGSLDDYTVGDSLDKTAVAACLKENYYPADARTASRKAGELVRFYNTDSDTVFVAMDGERLLAFIDDLGQYFYEDSSHMAHRKPGKWHYGFSDGDRMPAKSEGKQTSCYSLTDEANLIYLYERYYYGTDYVAGTEENEPNKNICSCSRTEQTEDDFIVPEYYTGFRRSDWMRRRKHGESDLPCRLFLCAFCRNV